MSHSVSRPTFCCFKSGPGSTSLLSVRFSNDSMMGFPKGPVVQTFCRPLLHKKQCFVPKTSCTAQSHSCLISNHVETHPAQSHTRSLCTRRFLAQNSFIGDTGRNVWLIDNAHHTGSLMTMVCSTQCVTPGLCGWDSILGVQLRVGERSAACDPSLCDQGSEAQLVTLLASAAPLLLRKSNCFSSAQLTLTLTVSIGIRLIVSLKPHANLREME